jgi:hypothetical protein
MALRLFGGQGDSKVRKCPACERKIAAEATFCPSCFLVIRPEGSADLRAHLRGARIPTDVYLLRKMQVEDPNTGPVVRLPPEASAALPAPRPVAAASAAASANTPPRSTTVDPANGPALTPAGAQPLAPPNPAGATPAPRGTTDDLPKRPVWTGVHSLVKFEAPLPPPAQTVEDIPTLYQWMLARDPLIPNNLELLDGIHARVFPNGPAANIKYEQHILLLISDDLILHPTRETLGNHLVLLTAAYRRAAGAYHTTAEKGQIEASVALWQMSSTASRLRLEAWVYHTRYGGPPEIIRPPRPRRSKA